MQLLWHIQFIIKFFKGRSKWEVGSGLIFTKLNNYVLKVPGKDPDIFVRSVELLLLLFFLQTFILNKLGLTLSSRNARIARTDDIWPRNASESKGGVIEKMVRVRHCPSQKITEIVRVRHCPSQTITDNSHGLKTLSITNNHRQWSMSGQSQTITRRIWFLNPHVPELFQLLWGLLLWSSMREVWI